MKLITDKSGNEVHLNTIGSNINITAPETMTLNCKNMKINVTENMTTSVGMNQSDTIGMNRSQSTGLNATQSVGAMKMTSIVGDASMFIIGKLTDLIEGNVHSETKKERNEVSAKTMKIQSDEFVNKHAKKEVQNNSGENSKAY